MKNNRLYKVLTIVKLFMIVGIGIDIIEIERIKKSVLQNGFLKKCFTENENIFFNTKKINSNSIAGNFAAKEAVSKALGTGFRGFSLKDIEVLRNGEGAPYIILYNNAQSLAFKKNIDVIHISISHSIEYAIAYAVAETR